MEYHHLIDAILRVPGSDHMPYTGHHTHAEVRCLASSLAAGMREADAGTKKPICLCTNDRALVAAALLAGLETAIPLILPHAASSAALADLRSEMPFATAIADAEAAAALPEGVSQLPLPVDLVEASVPADPRISVDSPWVYLFTGGSTGNPRIWTKTPANLLAESDYLVKRFAVTPEDRILATAPPNHIYGLLYAVLVPLLSGARVSSATPVFPHEILTALRDSGATILVSLPVHYRSLRAHSIDDHVLRLAFSSAGPLDPADAEAFSASTGTPIFEVYGSTETGGIASRCRQRGEGDLTPFEPVQVAIDGDQALVTSPFISPDLPRDEWGRFRLADRLEAAGNGRVRLLGRGDGIVKVGGKRVDLEVVRERLLRQEGVADAVVFSLGADSSRGAEIVAVVEGSAQSPALLAALQAAVEPQALPRRIQVVDKMPILVTGKYDRQALRAYFR